MRCRKQHLGTSEEPRSPTAEHRACSQKRGVQRRLCWHHRIQWTLPAKGLGSSPHSTAEETGWLGLALARPSPFSLLCLRLERLPSHFMALLRGSEGRVYAEVLCTP